MKPRYFKSALPFRSWLEKNHGRSQELLVGFYKSTSGRASVTYPQALDEALCFGWIDGVRRNVDEIRYSIRFTPRRPKSIWSQVNIGHVKRLMKSHRMRPSGLAAFRKRDEKLSNLYSYENRMRPMAPKLMKRLQANEKAWAYFETQAPWYRRTAGWWIMSAKKTETREKRLMILIDLCARNRKLPQLDIGRNKT